MQKDLSAYTYKIKKKSATDQQKRQNHKSKQKNVEKDKTALKTRNAGRERQT